VISRAFFSSLFLLLILPRKKLQIFQLSKSETAGPSGSAV